MFKADVKYRIAMKRSHFSTEQLRVFPEKNILFAITLTWAKALFTLKALIFSKTVD